MPVIVEAIALVVVTTILMIRTLKMDETRTTDVDEEATIELHETTQRANLIHILKSTKLIIFEETGVSRG